MAPSFFNKISTHNFTLTLTKHFFRMSLKHALTKQMENLQWEEMQSLPGMESRTRKVVNKSSHAHFVDKPVIIRFRLAYRCTADTETYDAFFIATSTEIP